MLFSNSLSMSIKKYSFGILLICLLMLSSCGLNSGSADPEANSENKNTIEETDENITGELSEKSAL